MEKLSSGITGFFNEHNEWTCTGAAMGRRSDTDAPQGARWQVYRLRLNSGGYDSGGAYWGHGTPLFHCYTDDGGAEFFTRAYSRNEAIEELQARFPGARLLRGMSRTA